MTKQIIIIDIPHDRLDAFLTQNGPSHSRSFWQKRCIENQVLVNDAPAKPNARLKEGDVVTIAIPKKTSPPFQEIPVIYEDEDVLVLNKPSGILTHAKGITVEEFTLADFVRPYVEEETETNRPGIVHRLDRLTSGMIIVAKNDTAKRWLQKQFSERKVKKTYIALVEGHLKESTATLDLPLQRNPKKPQTFRVNPSGKPAQTAYETLHTFRHTTLLKLSPYTGRTHQLRVHMHYLGHPIVGDPLYGHIEKNLGRMFLHAATLEITLPSRERKVFEAPLPEELAAYLRKLT